jgi:hypothetical protein
MGKQQGKTPDLKWMVAYLRRRPEYSRYVEAEEYAEIQEACDRLTICCVGMLVVMLCVKAWQRWGW